ncbi:DUF5908 family protein [Flavilitoribacter nigricans]|uniref:DUF5908 family protein n=1 Tax=Flavilitoribacter nigricans TaxID=70997 RepID=UPI001474705E|nr:DUF5908 family protein [Flavilitoribacter nigricans]
MPIEIRELNIRVNVRGRGEDSEESSAHGDNTSDIDREELMAEIIEQILEILDNRKER